MHLRVFPKNPSNGLDDQILVKVILTSSSSRYDPFIFQVDGRVSFALKYDGAPHWKMVGVDLVTPYVVHLLGRNAGRDSERVESV